MPFSPVSTQGGQFFGQGQRDRVGLGMVVAVDLSQLGRAIGAVKLGV